MPQQRIRYTDEQLLGIATKVLNKTGWRVHPTYIASIARVESQGDPYAYRFEAEIDDASTGLCQSLLKNNAQWLHKSFPKYGAAGGVPYPEKVRNYHEEADIRIEYRYTSSKQPEIRVWITFVTTLTFSASSLRISVA
jgi:hypothetical protein